VKKTKRLKSLTELAKPVGFFTTDFVPAYAPSRADVMKMAIPIPPPVKVLGAMDDSGMELEEVKRMTAYGQAIPEAQINWYASQGFIGYQTCAILAQNWLIEKCCEMPARDAVRNWYDITINDGTEVEPKVLDMMKRMDKRMKLKQNCVEFEKFGRVFGVRVALPIIEVGDDKAKQAYYEAPYNPDSITAGMYKGISQIDPYWIFPELVGDSAMNPASQNFYEPTFWRVGSLRIHKSHLIVMRRGSVPDILKPSYLYGGIPLPQQIAERVYAAERTANEAPMLAMTKRTNTLYTDMEKAVADQRTFEGKLKVWASFRDNYGVLALGEGEKLEQHDTSLTDLDAVIMTNYQLVAAIANVPATKLMGTSPKGFNATGDFESRSYHEELETIQECDMTPLIERHHELLIRSFIAPRFGIPVFETTLSWNPPDSPTAKEMAEVNSLVANTAKAYSDIGAIDGIDVRQKLTADKEAGYNFLDLNREIEPEVSDEEVII